LIGTAALCLLSLLLLPYCILHRPDDTTVSTKRLGIGAERRVFGTIRTPQLVSMPVLKSSIQALSPLKFRKGRILQCYGKGFGSGGSSSSSSSSSKAKKNTKSKKSIDRFLSGRDLPSSFRYSGSVRPGKQSPRRSVKNGIELPEYAKSGTPSTKGIMPWDNIEVKSEADIEKMRVSGRIAREILDAAGRLVKPGVLTDEIDELVHRMCMEKNCYPSPLNYNKFPKSVCTSVNEVICHGIPDSSELKSGDIINIDVTIFHDGFHGDCSEMFVVGEADDASKRLIQVTYNAWQEALKYCKPGAKYNQLGGIIEKYVRKRGYSTSREFVAHGIGKSFHVKPFILHYENNENLGTMQPGHVFTVEPMICEGTAEHILWPDQWTATTKDGKRSAQFEHTVLITKDGAEFLTGKIPSSPIQFWEDQTTQIKV